MPDKVNAVLVIGAGVGGIRASLDLAESGFKVYLTDRSPGIGGTLSQLDSWFPDNQCELCKLLPVFNRDECSQFCLRHDLMHPNIELIPNSKITAFAGEPGNFKATLNVPSRWVIEERCTACGLCAEVCPVEISDEFNRSLKKRKAIYVRNPQAIPNVYTIDRENCTKCGKCSVACKSTCINVKTLEVDNSRCVACYNCISVCPENSIKYERFKGIRKNTSHVTDTSKRDFIGKTLLYGAALAGISRKSPGQEVSGIPPGNIPNKKNHPVSPPGSISLRHFNDRCTACNLCVTVCPTSVLQPSFLEYGFLGMAQPHMAYDVEYCNFECTICGEVCPTGAIMPLTVAVKKLTQTGQVQFIRDKCIVYEKNTACGSCSEHCPTQAVKMVPYKGVLTIPETNIEICIGCGACEFACPVVPHKAIFVDGNKNHRIAKAPKIEEMEVVTQEEFPF